MCDINGKDYKGKPCEKDLPNSKTILYKYWRVYITTA
jgi:hypothetical protein